VTKTVRYCTGRRRKMDSRSFKENHHGFVESQLKIQLGDGFVLEDVPHLTNFLPNLPVSLSILSKFYLNLSSLRNENRMLLRFEIHAYLIINPIIQRRIIFHSSKL
jgi:hypothetical protein